MANSWNIPINLENEIRQRDKKCIYCGNSFTSVQVSKKSSATWEHIINDAKIITRENIALCCCSCNSSKGSKKLSVWLESKYCIEKRINYNTVSLIVKKAIQNGA